MNRTASGIGMYQSIYGVYNRILRNAGDHDTIACDCFTLLMIPVQLRKEIEQRPIPAFVYSSKFKILSIFADIPCR